MSLHEHAAVEDQVAAGAPDAHAEVERVARDYVPMLPVASEQLRDIGREVEEAVLGLCTNFRDMVAKARASVRESQELLQGGGANQKGVEVLVETSQRSLEQLMSRLLHASETSMRAVYRIEDLQRGMQQIDETLRLVEEIAMRARLLSVNAKLEAARQSDGGKAFGVVASEISDVARLCATMGESIDATVKRMRRDVNATVEDLRSLASEDVNQILAGRTAVTAALDDISRVHLQMEQSMHVVAHAGESLAADVAGAIMRMQFQDKVSQRLSHVTHALDEMHDELTAALAEVPERGTGDSLRRQQEILQRLARTYTMAAEHGVQARLQGKAVAAHQAEGSVDLF